MQGGEQQHEREERDCRNGWNAAVWITENQTWTGSSGSYGGADRGRGVEFSSATPSR